jgi:hypothetical protein
MWAAPVSRQRLIDFQPDQKTLAASDCISENMNLLLESMWHCAACSPHPKGAREKSELHSGTDGTLSLEGEGEGKAYFLQSIRYALHLSTD